MRRTSERDLQLNLGAVLDRVTEGQETLVVKREGGKAAAVLMSLQEVHSWRETMYLLQGRNGEVLLESVAQIERGQVVVLDEAAFERLDAATHAAGVSRRTSI